MPRRRGAQLGNANALKHGRYSKPLRAARLAAVQAEWRERERQRSEWINTIKPIDYGAICDELRALRRAKEAS